MKKELLTVPKLDVNASQFASTLSLNSNATSEGATFLKELYASTINELRNVYSNKSAFKLEEALIQIRKAERLEFLLISIIDMANYYCDLDSFPTKKELEEEIEDGFESGRFGELAGLAQMPENTILKSFQAQFYNK